MTPAAGWTPIAEQRLDYGRFKQLAVYTPAKSARGVVLLLSGTDGWTPLMADLANRIARQGASSSVSISPNSTACSNTTGESACFRTAISRT